MYLVIILEYVMAVRMILSLLKLGPNSLKYSILFKHDTSLHCIIVAAS